MKKKTSKRKTKKRRSAASSKSRKKGAAKAKAEREDGAPMKKTTKKKTTKKKAAKKKVAANEKTAAATRSERSGNDGNGRDGSGAGGDAAERNDSLAPALPCRAEPGQFLTFLVGGDEYAVPILESREIVELGSCAEVPSTPEWMLGLMNLRGAVIPVVDLSAKLGIPWEERRGRSAVIVVQPRYGEEEVVLGMLVEDVREVAELTAEQLEPVPSFGAPIRADCLMGLGQHDGRVLLLLDVHRTLSLDELLSVSHLAADADETGGRPDEGGDDGPEVPA